MPAVREVVADAGVVVEPFDVDAFAAATRRLLDDADRRRELRHRARRRFGAEFAISPVVDRIEALYADACAAAGGRAR